MIEFTDIEPVEGRCFDNVNEYFLANIKDHPELKIVHGLMTGQGHIEGYIHAHAWLQYSLDNVLIAIDPSYKVYYPWGFYMSIGRNKGYTVYTAEDYYNMQVEYGTVGPWKLEYDRKTKQGMEIEEIEKRFKIL